jgi:prepilin-type N-terminal cleavage/methylation domain-containing protein
MVRKKKSFSNESGFTLIEVLIAVVILAGGLLVLNNSSSRSIYSVQKSEKLHIIANLLKQKALELEFENKGKRFEEMKTEDSGDFGKDYPDMKWKMQMEPFPSPNFSDLLLQQGGQDDMLLTIMNKFSEHLEKSVKEMKVSILWNYDKKILEYSVTVLLFDYEVPIGI